MYDNEIKSLKVLDCPEFEPEYKNSPSPRWLDVGRYNILLVNLKLILIICSQYLKVDLENSIFIFF